MAGAGPVPSSPLLRSASSRSQPPGPIAMRSLSSSSSRQQLVPAAAAAPPQQQQQQQQQQQHAHGVLNDEDSEVDSVKSMPKFSLLQFVDKGLAESERTEEKPPEPEPEPEMTEEEREERDARVWAGQKARMAAKKLAMKEARRLEEQRIIKQQNALVAAGAEEEAKLKLLAQRVLDPEKFAAAQFGKELRDKLDAETAATVLHNAQHPPKPQGSQFLMDDFAALAAGESCQVCITGEAGCPCCFKAPKRERVAGAVGAGSARLNVPHTTLVSHTEIRRWRWPFTTTNVYVKMLPTGVATHFTFQAEWSVRYLYQQYRALCGPTGTEDLITLLVPTQIGMFEISLEELLPTETRTGVDKGRFTLLEYGARQRFGSLGLFRVARVHDRLTAQLAASFMRRNFTLDRPVSTRIFHYLDALPKDVQLEDFVQPKLGAWIEKAIDHQHRWEAKDAEHVKEAIAEHHREQAEKARLARINDMRHLEVREKEARRREAKAAAQESRRQLEQSMLLADVPDPEQEEPPAQALKQSSSIPALPRILPLPGFLAPSGPVHSTRSEPLPRSQAAKAIADAEARQPRWSLRSLSSSVKNVMTDAFSRTNQR